MLENNEERQLSLMLRSHLERALMGIWSTGGLVTDDDEDYPFRSATAACWVGLAPGPEPAVRVFAHAAYGVPKSARLLTEINVLNQRSKWAKVSWHDGVVLVDQLIHWTHVDQDSVERALDSVTCVADDIGTMIATVYGGQTPFPAQTESSEQDEDAA